LVPKEFVFEKGENLLQNGILHFVFRLRQSSEIDAVIAHKQNYPKYPEKKILNLKVQTGVWYLHYLELRPYTLIEIILI